jgi:hypothetical protein
MPKGERNYAAQPVADALGLRAVIDGLASDLQEMRAGTLRAPEALARAALAKQLFNGVRLFLVAHQIAAKSPPQGAGRDVTPAIEGGTP